MKPKREIMESFVSIANSFPPHEEVNIIALFLLEGDLDKVNKALDALPDEVVQKIEGCE